MKTEIKLIIKYTIVILLLSLSSFSFASDSDYDKFIAKSNAEMAELTKQMQVDLAESVYEVAKERTTYTIYYGAWSKHLNDSDVDRNENNQLMAFEYQNWIIGTFENSFYDRTWLAGYNFKYHWDKLEVGVVVGISYGYDDYDIRDVKLMKSYNGWMPVLFPHISYPLYNSDSLEVRPTVGLQGSAVTALVQFEHSF
ncbi:antimicrobial peptide resistance and lipid A acyl ation protein PagP [Vibrio phage K45]